MRASHDSHRLLLLRLSDSLVSARSYDDFEVVSDFLANPQPDNQARIRRRGQRFPNGSILWTYQHTVRTVKNDQMLELRTSLNQRDYWVWLQLLLSLLFSSLLAPMQ